MPVLVGEQAVVTLNILWSEENHFQIYILWLIVMILELKLDCWRRLHNSYFHEMQVNIEEDDTRIYVDIGYGGYVR